jgi:uncharacterized protein (TIGR02646 family)
LKKITKGKEPISLTAYRSSISSADMKKETIYEDYKENAILRKQLLAEQGYVCCYCMSQISERNSKIEHFLPQSLFRDNQIEYSNLLVACKGGEGTKEHYCDTKKANQILNSIDFSTDMAKKIKYFKNGKVSSLESFEKKESSLTKEMNEVLNLNSDMLVKNRKQTYDDFKNQKKWNKAYLQQIIASYQSGDNSKSAPYSEMMVYLLSKKLQGK